MSPSTSAPESTPPLWRGLLPLVICSVLATQDSVVAAFGAVCKPITIGLLSLIGLSTVDHGLSIQVEHLNVPWTRDCAGMNLLLVLLAVFAWMNRHIAQDKSYWTRMALMLPAAIAANVLRVLSLIGFRFAVYPEVESPQLHYFIGFIWLIPFALLSLPRKSARPKKALWFELLHISAVMGLIAPLLTLSNHWLTAVGALFFLVNSHFTETFTPKHLLAFSLWLLTALVITWTGIESIWLPWLLVCPLTINHRWIFRPDGLLTLTTTCPLFVLLPAANIIAAVIFAYVAYHWWTQQDATSAPPTVRLGRNWERGLTLTMAPLLFAPYLASILTAQHGHTLQPPESAAKRVLDGMGYELNIEGQPAGLGLLWYDPQGNDRHHAVEVCLQYRGIQLQPTTVDKVKTDGTYWFKEFFLVGDELIDDHRDYLWKTLGFRRDPGVHLILVADAKTTTANTFSTQATDTALKLYHSLNKTQTPQNSDELGTQ